METRHIEGGTPTTRPIDGAPAANPFAAPPAPANPFAPPAPTPANPFAAGPPVEAGPPVNPFATPAPVNPFATPPADDNPYRMQAPMPAPVAPPMPMPGPAAIPGVQPLGALRPFTIAITIGSAIYFVALLHATIVAGSMKPATSMAEFSALSSAMKRAEGLYIIGWLALIVTVIPWWLRAAKNAAKLCADKPRYSPANAWTFLMPLLNLLVVGNAFEDISKHSHERRQRPAAVVRAFRFAILIALALRLVALLVATRQLTDMGGQDAAFFVFGFGDPARFIYQTGPELQTLTVVVSLLSTAIPVLAIFACFSIERAQIDTHRKLRASAI